MKTTGILIAGGGVPGLVLALLLARAGCAVTVADPQIEKPIETTVPSGRTIALMAPSLEILERTGLWPLLKKTGGALETLSIADDGNLNGPVDRVDFHAHEIGAPYFGYNIPLPDLLAAARAVAKKEKNITLTTAGLKTITQGDHDITAALTNGGTIRAALLVGADGRSSAVRKLAGIGEWSEDYEQTALTGLLQHSKTHHNASVEFHRAGGPFTIVPMPGNRSSFVWVERHDDAEKIIRLRRPDLINALQERTRGLIGAVDLMGGIESTKLMILKADKLIENRIALMAEAAHVISPIGAQGMNLSLRDAASLAHQILDAVSLGLDPGSAPFLNRYARDRYHDVGGRVTGTDQLNRLVRTLDPRIVGLRRLGMKIMKSKSPLRSLIMQEMFNPQSGLQPRPARASVKTSTPAAPARSKTRAHS